VSIDVERPIEDLARTAADLSFSVDRHRDNVTAVFITISACIYALFGHIT